MSRTQVPKPEIVLPKAEIKPELKQNSAETEVKLARPQPPVPRTDVVVEASRPVTTQQAAAAQQVVIQQVVHQTTQQHVVHQQTERAVTSLDRSRQAHSLQPNSSLMETASSPHYEATILDRLVEFIARTITRIERIILPPNKKGLLSNLLRGNLLRVLTGRKKELGIPQRGKLTRAQIAKARLKLKSQARPTLRVLANDKECKVSKSKKRSWGWFFDRSAENK